MQLYTCMLCKKDKKCVNISYKNGTNSAKEDILELCGNEIEQYLDITRVMCYKCVKHVNKAAHLKRRVFEVFCEHRTNVLDLDSLWNYRLNNTVESSHYENQTDDESSSKALSIGLQDSEKLPSPQDDFMEMSTTSHSLIGRSSPENELEDSSDDLLIVSHSIPYDKRSAKDFEIANKKYQHYHGTPSLDKEVQQVNFRGRRRVRGHNWTRRKGSQRSRSRSVGRVSASSQNVRKVSASSQNVEMDSASSQNVEMVSASSQNVGMVLANSQNVESDTANSKNVRSTSVTSRTSQGSTSSRRSKSQKELEETQMKRILSDFLYQDDSLSQFTRAFLNRNGDIFDDGKTYDIQEWCEESGKAVIKTRFASEIRDRLLAEYESVVYECPVHSCQAVLRSLEDITEHRVKEHNEMALFWCEQCKFSYLSQEHLDKHKDNHYEKFVSYCIYCSEEFRNRKMYEEHLNEHLIHSFPCIYCDKFFLKKQLCDRHVREQHPGRKKKIKRIKPQPILDRIDKYPDSRDEASSRNSVNNPQEFVVKILWQHGQPDDSNTKNDDELLNVNCDDTDMEEDNTD